MYLSKYYFPLDRFMDRERFSQLKKFAEGKETPFLIIDLEVIEKKYRELKDNLPFSQIFYAIKANPSDEVLTLLRDLGSSFDVASRFELDQLLRLNVDPTKISFGNTIKKPKDIAYFYEKGVRLFATDSIEDLTNLSEYAPGSKIFFRLLTEGTGSDWPLSRKFGAHPDMIYNLIVMSKDMGVIPYGLSFHVGSQQRDIGQWDDAISKCKYLFDAVKSEGIHLKMINLGGGLPADYLDPTLSINLYASEIKRFLYEDFGDNMPEIFIEPGRSLSGDAGVIISEVILLTKKSKNDLYRWLYLDIGVFGGLIETINESIKYPIFFDSKGDAEEVIIAGPTCDSMDIMYEKYRYKMPSTVKPGDKVYIFSTGAYTQTYSSVYFNGFPPLKSYIFKPPAKN
ncbi:MAG TPA: type III PLP-dependent enzyme [Spirochaetia bacterium]|jgi:ornithine decarboxylase|nr:type III PLP-dependent enzyme [Spirochaetia bacterium]